MPTGKSGQTLPCRLRRRWLLASTAIGVAGCLALSQLVYADNECGAIVGNSVTCTSAGNNYTGGITYKPTDDLTLVVDDNARIFPSSGNEGIDVIFGGDVDIEMSGKISTLGDYDVVADVG